MATPAPIITLTTDFGLDDWYVAAVKSVLLKSCPTARLVDVSHLIPPGNILAASVCLERAVAAFQHGAIHLAVVDPGVGSSRRLIIASVRGQFVLCPDNGLITWAARRHIATRAHEITWRPVAHSNTFHGRDILAPAAAMLASQTVSLQQIAQPIHNPVLLDIAPVLPPARSGQIIYFDRFGNAITNLLEETVNDARDPLISVKAHSLGHLQHSYAHVPPGQPLALIGSSGLLEISVRDGSARQSLLLSVGDPVTLS